MGLPAYLQILQELRHRIASGAWRVGDRMPTDEAMMQEFGVSRFTVRAAVDVLVADGIVKRYRSRGTFVAARPGGPEGWMLSSLEDIMMGSFPTLPEIIESRLVVADAGACAALGLEKRAKIFRIHALRRVKGEPYAFSSIYVPAAIAAALPRNWPQRLRKSSIVNMIEEGAGMSVAKAIQVASATRAEGQVADFLETEVGAPLLTLERTYITREGRAVEHAKILCRPDRYRQIIAFRRRNVRDVRPERAVAEGSNTKGESNE
jgi:GntR family transcriptional regulator